MPKIPDSLPVKITVSNLTLEVPKALFEHSALRAAIFVCRKGRSAATRRTKWFTLADPSLVPSNTRQSVALASSHLGGSRQASTSEEADPSAEHHIEDVPVEMAVLEYSGINNVVYEVDMKPLNVFDGDWVFDQKTTHPLSVFAKILVRNRPGVRLNAAKSEQESNLHEMLQMDHDDLEGSEDGESDNYSNEHGDGGVRDDPALEMSLSGIGLTEAQMADLCGEESSNEMVMNQMRRGMDCKRRYLQFPKTIDMATIVNTKAKTANFCERLVCKNAALLGTMLSFTVTAEVPREKLTKFEDEVKSKEGKEELKRREKEEKLLEKERKKEEKEEQKRREKEDRKNGKKTEKAYGADVTEAHNPGGAKNELKAPPQQQSQPSSTPDGAGKKKKGGFLPLQLVKSVFTKEEKPEKVTPFAVKLTSTPFPYLVMLYNFQLGKLVKDPENYRAVHIRLGTDAVSTEDFPRLLLDATKPSVKTESTITWYDGSLRNAVSFNFGTACIFFGDKAIRNITGFETLRALQEHERQYHEAKKAALEGSLSQRRESANSDLFHEQLMNVGTLFHPITFEPTKYSANSNQALATKFTRVTAQLIVAEKTIGEVRLSDEAEKREYVRRLKKEQHQREKAAKEAERAAKEAEKAAKKEAEKKKKEGSGADGAATSNTADVSNEASRHLDTETTTSTATTTTTGVDESSKAAGTPSTTAANHVSPKPAKDSDEDSHADRPPTFEAGAADHLDATEEVPATPESGKKEKKEKRERDGSKIVLNESSSFQLSTYVINEDYVPADGLQYRILFQTGEELTFRARRFFLPSVCLFGDDGCKREPTLSDYMNATTD
jgi:ParB-like chromosome segregation protein Spo0J